MHGRTARYLSLTLLVCVVAVRGYYNETIDDSLIPIDGWKAWDHPGVWQDILIDDIAYNSTVTWCYDLDRPLRYSFNGTAIYYRALIFLAGGNFTVTLDDAPSGGMVNTFTANRSEVRSDIVWSATDLPYGQHDLVITKLPNTDDWAPVKVTDRDSYLYFDAFIITRPNATDNPPLASPRPAKDPQQSQGVDNGSPSSPAAAIAGGVVGAAVLIALVAGFFLYRRKKRRESMLTPLVTQTTTNTPSVVPTPFTLPESSTRGMTIIRSTLSPNVPPGAASPAVGAPQVALRRDVESLRAQVEALRVAALGSRAGSSDGNTSSGGRPGTRRALSDGSLESQEPPTQATLDRLNQRIERMDIHREVDTDDPPPEYSITSHPVL